VKQSPPAPVDANLIFLMLAIEHAGVIVDYPAVTMSTRKGINKPVVQADLPDLRRATPDQRLNRAGKFPAQHISAARAGGFEQEIPPDLLLRFIN